MGECWKQICFYQLFKLFPTSTCSTRLNDLTPTVEKAAFATAPASAPRVPTATIDCFRYGEFRSSGECWKQLCENNFYIAAQPRGVLNRRACCPPKQSCFYQLFKLFPISTRSTRLNNYSSPLAELPLALCRGEMV